MRAWKYANTHTLLLIGQSLVAKNVQCEDSMRILSPCSSRIWFTRTFNFSRHTLLRCQKRYEFEIELGWPIKTSRFQIPQQTCRNYVECRINALQRFEQCNDDFSDNSTSTASNDTRKEYCRSQIDSKLKLLRSLHMEKQRQQLDCVNRRKQDAVLIHPKKVSHMNWFCSHEIPAYLLVEYIGINVTYFHTYPLFCPKTGSGV